MRDVGSFRILNFIFIYLLGYLSLSIGINLFIKEKGQGRISVDIITSKLKLPLLFFLLPPALCNHHHHYCRRRCRPDLNSIHVILHDVSSSVRPPRRRNKKHKQKQTANHQYVCDDDIVEIPVIIRKIKWENIGRWMINALHSSDRFLPSHIPPELCFYN